MAFPFFFFFIELEIGKLQFYSLKFGKMQIFFFSGMCKVFFIFY